MLRRSFTWPAYSLRSDAVADDTGQTPAQRIAAGYAVQGGALELGTVVVDGQVDPTARVRIPLAMLNRHGLVAGATGTGKTKTLQAMAGQLSDAGVPVLLADVKGDLSGMARAGTDNARVARYSSEMITGGAASQPLSRGLARELPPAAMTLRAPQVFGTRSVVAPGRRPSLPSAAAQAKA